MPVDETDADLIKRIIRGEAAAFETFVRRFEAHLARLMWRFTRDTQAHTELVHEVLVQAYLSLARFRGEAPLIHWLSAIATRTGYNWWEQQQRRARWRQLPAEIVAPETPAAPPDLFALLTHLKPDERAVLTLTYYDDKSTQEIAEIMQWSPTATRMRLTRARRRLRTIAEQHGIKPEDIK